MPSLSAAAMQNYLGRSIASFNQNKLNGLLAEISLRNHLGNLGLQDRVSPGGWIARREGPGVFGHSTAVFFPEVIHPNFQYPAGRDLPHPTTGLHTICATFHQSGISSFYCVPTIGTDENPDSIAWHSIELGLPIQQPYRPLIDAVRALSFRERQRPWKFLRYHTDTSTIPVLALPDEFSKENLRVSFQGSFFSELSDIDGIFWGQQHTYPLEIKEKTAAVDSGLGAYFGLDIGPFVKLAFYAAKRGNLHSIFIVREIDSAESRNLVGWWMITFDQLAQYASWVMRSGGPNMAGGRSAVVRVPRAEFQALNAGTLSAL
jgi:hypothetical protein